MNIHKKSGIKCVIMYSYYASIDYGHYNGRLPMWVTEGIAEYVGYPGERMEGEPR